MGMERRIQFANGVVPSWAAVVGQLAQQGQTPALRMIDGLPAFPDEVPPDEWAEMRVALDGGMITLRRHVGVVSCICWGTAEPALVRSWNVLTWAMARAGQGTITEPGGRDRDADAFYRDELGGPG